MDKFTFIILHYQTIEDTIECVNSILETIKYPELNIVVVDNASTNGSGKTLEEMFSMHKKIFFIHNPENLGFAKGNNVGYSFAKDKLRSEFIALINNDTIINQSDFIEKTIEKYKTDSFDVMGPDILSMDSRLHQNPKPLSIRNKYLLKKLITHHLVLLSLNYLGLDQFIERAKKLLFRKPFIQNTSNLNIDYNSEMINVKLAGSCLIFSPSFVNAYDGLYDKTFLYSEEEILFYMMKRDGKKVIYYPEIKILHKEDVTLNSLFRTNLLRRRFYYKNYIKSAIAFLKLINADGTMETWDE